jgi:hypothetical protein
MSLRRENLAHQSRRDTMTQIQSGPAGATGLWLPAHPQAFATFGAPMHRAAFLVPALIAAFGFCKHRAIVAGVRRAAAHLALIQRAVFGFTAAAGMPSACIDEASLDLRVPSQGALP